MKNKLIIVTNDNESYDAMGVGSLSITFGFDSTEIEGSGHFKCRNMHTGQFKDVYDSDIKLLARPKQKSKWQERLEEMHRKNNK